MKSVLEVAVGVVLDRHGRVLIAKRPVDKHQGGLWEFPGGKIETGETQQQALKRELYEELSIQVKNATKLISIPYDYSEFSVRLWVWTVDRYDGVPQGSEGQRVEWVFPSDLKNYAFPEANRSIVNALCLPEFYAILDDSQPAELFSNLKTILDKGVKLIQLRLKTISSFEAQEFVERIDPLCRRHNASLLLNSSVKGVKASQFNGLHLTSRDLMALNSRPACHGWLAASCHNAFELSHARRMGVDFAVLAPVMPTTTHPNAKTLGWHAFQKLTEAASIPVYALGGLGVADLTRVREAGGQGVAGIRAFIEQNG